MRQTIAVFCVLAMACGSTSSSSPSDASAGAGGTDDTAESKGDAASAALTTLEKYCYPESCDYSSSSLERSKSLQASCEADKDSQCIAALADSKKLKSYYECSQREGCGPECSFRKDYAKTWNASLIELCVSTINASCGGETPTGFSHGDCDDVLPILRDDVAEALKACFSRPCEEMTSSCFSEVLRGAEPDACAHLK